MPRSIPLVVLLASSAGALSGCSNTMAGLIMVAAFSDMEGGGGSSDSPIPEQDDSYRLVPESVWVGGKLGDVDALESGEWDVVPGSDTLDLEAGVPGEGHVRLVVYANVPWWEVPEDQALWFDLDGNVPPTPEWVSIGIDGETAPVDTYADTHDSRHLLVRVTRPEPDLLRVAFSVEMVRSFGRPDRQVPDLVQGYVTARLVPNDTGD